MLMYDSNTRLQAKLCDFFQLATLEQEKLKSGDILIVEEGKLPPKVMKSRTIITQKQEIQHILAEPRIY